MYVYDREQCGPILITKARVWTKMITICLLKLKWEPKSLKTLKLGLYKNYIYRSMNEVESELNNAKIKMN